jgi:hypothetical protein
MFGSLKGPTEERLGVRLGYVKLIRLYKHKKFD